MPNLPFYIVFFLRFLLLGIVWIIDDNHQLNRSTSRLTWFIINCWVAGRYSFTWIFKKEKLYIYFITCIEQNKLQRMKYLRMRTKQINQRSWVCQKGKCFISESTWNDCRKNWILNSQEISQVCKVLFFGQLRPITEVPSGFWDIWVMYENWLHLRLVTGSTNI